MLRIGNVAVIEYLTGHRFDFEHVVFLAVLNRAEFKVSLDDWVFQIPLRRDFARVSTVSPRCLQRSGHCAHLSFTAVGGKIQATRFAGGR